jgi:hypothetical protein
MGSLQASSGVSFEEAAVEIRQAGYSLSFLIRPGHINESSSFVFGVTSTPFPS